MTCSGSPRPARRQPTPSRAPARPLLILALLAIATTRANAAWPQKARHGVQAPAATAAAAGSRRQLRAGTSRGLLQLCTCPAPDAATATCSTVAQNEQDSLLRGVLQYCTRTGWAPANCCPQMPISDPKWPQWVACLCAQNNPSLTSFVDGPNIVQSCGCGWSQSSSPVPQGNAASIVGSIASLPASSGASASASAAASAGAAAGSAGGGPPGGTTAEQVVRDLAASYQSVGALPPFSGGGNSSTQQTATANASASVGGSAGSQQG